MIMIRILLLVALCSGAVSPAVQASQALITDEKISAVSLYLDALPSLKSPVEVKEDYRKPFEYAKERVRRREERVANVQTGDSFTRNVLASLRSLKVSGVIPSEGLRPGMLILDGKIYEIGDTLTAPGESEVTVRLLQVREEEYLVTTKDPSGGTITIPVPVTMFSLSAD
jgi:hypothetical protein